jgi:predicted transposase/invertase (TIGR01784 family)
MNMLMTEWNIEDAQKVWFEDGMEKGREEGREEESFSIAQNLVKLGLPIETVISATRLDPEKVKALYQQ